MTQASPRLKPKTVEKWLQSVGQILYSGEQIWALVQAARINRPADSRLRSAKRIKLEVSADDIGWFDFGQQRRTCQDFADYDLETPQKVSTFGSWPQPALAQPLHTPVEAFITTQPLE